MTPKPRYASTTERQFYRDKRIKRVIRGLLAIAAIAMPDTYFATDRRVRAGQKLLKDLK